MKCIETHLKSWSVSCPMDSVMEMFKTDLRFMHYAQGYLSWLTEDLWNYCLGKWNSLTDLFREN